MKLHRFYLADTKLTDDLWVHDQPLLNQWNRVLRLKPDSQIVLFDGVETDRLYKIVEIYLHEANLESVTDLKRQLPSKDIYLFWSLLKKDKSDWVLQKATELGVSHFVPLLADRSEKTGFNIDRAKRIVIEASEQCGRSDIPSIREPIGVEAAIEQYQDKVKLFYCDQADEITPKLNGEVNESLGILIGPEGGWTDTEISIFKEKDLDKIGLHDFTLRAETAAISAVQFAYQQN